MIRPLLLLCCLGSVSAASQDPFLPGLRWIHGASPGQAWMPVDGDITQQGALVWGAALGANPHLYLLDAHEQGAPGPRREYALDASTQLVDSAAARQGPLLALVQDAGGSELLAFDPLALVGSQALVPAWSYSLGSAGVAPRLVVDDDGLTLAAGVYLPAQGLVRVDILAGTDGLSLAQSTLPGAALDVLAISGDGQRIAVAAGLDLYILDPGGVQIFHTSLSSSTRALAWAHDGTTLAVGRFGALDVWREGAAGWALHLTLPAHPSPAESSTWLPARVALGAHGDNVAVAWWKFTTGFEAAFEIWAGDLRLRRLVQADSGLGLQNLPTSVSIAATGERAAFACWGNGLDPEAWLLDRDDPGQDYAMDLPGSVRSVCLDSSGSRIMVGHRDSHENVFGSTGAVRLYDTGERPLQQIGSAQPGGSLDLVARRPGASLALFLVGQPAAPLSIRGVNGHLLLERSSILVQLAPVDGSGRAELSLPLGQGSAWVGSSLGIQTAFRLAGQTELVETLARPFIF